MDASYFRATQKRFSASTFAPINLLQIRADVTACGRLFLLGQALSTSFFFAFVVLKKQGS
jgi:hypothetical protein